MDEPTPPQLADEARWYAEHTALLVTTLKWAALGLVAGICVGAGTKAFLWSLSVASLYTRRLDAGWFRYYFLLPLAIPACVWLIRTYAPSAKGHGTEAVIAAVHKQSGKVDWAVAPIKLLATVVTLAFGGSVGKEGPCAQIGAALASMFADVAKLNDLDRRRLVICGISGGFAAVFGTPISGALFGIEVLYLGRIEYDVLLPCLVSGIVAHLVCGAQAPVPAIAGTLSLRPIELIPLSLLFGAIFGVAALILIELMRSLERSLRRFEEHPYVVATLGGVALAILLRVAGESYAGLGTATIESAMTGAGGVFILAFLIKSVLTAGTLEVGGSGGIVTPLFFIGSTCGAAFAHLLRLPTAPFAAFGFVGVVAAAANTPIAAAVMGMELLPPALGVYAALSACVAFLIVGHRSVYASQKIGLSKSIGLEIELGGEVGDVRRASIQIREGTLASRVYRAIGRVHGRSGRRMRRPRDSRRRH